MVSSGHCMQSSSAHGLVVGTLAQANTSHSDWSDAMGSFHSNSCLASRKWSQNLALCHLPWLTSEACSMALVRWLLSVSWGSLQAGVGWSWLGSLMHPPELPAAYLRLLKPCQGHALLDDCYITGDIWGSGECQGRVSLKLWTPGCGLTRCLSAFPQNEILEHITHWSESGAWRDASVG